MQKFDYRSLHSKRITFYHNHLVPKYKDDEFEWGGVFAMNPDRITLSEEEYKKLIDIIKENL